MPYKNPEDRKKYDREYKRRWRARHQQVRVLKAYLCLRYPNLQLEGLAFRDGWFISADPQQQAIIERHQAYGTHIFSWRLEPILPAKD